MVLTLFISLSGYYQVMKKQGLSSIQKRAVVIIILDVVHRWDQWTDSQSTQP